VSLLSKAVEFTTGWLIYAVGPYKSSRNSSAKGLKPGQQSSFQAGGQEG